MWIFFSFCFFNPNTVFPDKLQQLCPSLEILVYEYSQVKRWTVATFILETDLCDWTLSCNQASSWAWWHHNVASWKPHRRFELKCSRREAESFHFSTDFKQLNQVWLQAQFRALPAIGKIQQVDKLKQGQNDEKTTGSALVTQWMERKRKTN